MSASSLTIDRDFFKLFTSSSENILKPYCKYKLQPKNDSMVPPQALPFNRRRTLLCNGAGLITLFSLDCVLTTLPVRAEVLEPKAQEGEEDKGIVGTITSLFDPNEKTKSGKVLPKNYLKSAREVVKTLRESLKEDPKDNAKFRRVADAAKESIREYLSDWRGQKMIVTEESYMAIEKAIRSLASFYSKAGPSAPLPEEVKSNILDNLNIAEDNL